MLLKPTICETIDKFFSCTNIPVVVIDNNGNLTNDIGHSTDSLRLLKDNNIYLNAKDKFSSNNNEFITISILSEINFTACFIDKTAPELGMFILGPYNIKKSNNYNTLYKPKTCMPHMITLLRNIFYDTSLKFNLLETKNLNHSFYVNKAIKYINNNYNEPITLEDVSSFLKINKCYFCTLFKKETQKTFSQFLNEVRIEKSKDMLLKNDMPILDIALSVGFNNQNYYNMTFKKLTNQTPLNFRNNYHKN